MVSGYAPVGFSGMAQLAESTVRAAAPVEVAEFALQPPQALQGALARSEICRVEVLLLAGEQVRAALKEYDDGLRAF